MSLADSHLGLAGPSGEHPLRRWTLSLGAALAVHGVAFLIVTRMPPALPITPPPAMVVDLAIPAPPPPVPVPDPPKPVPPPPPPPKVIEPPPPPPPKVLAPDPIPIPPKPPKPPKKKLPPRPKEPPPIVQPQVQVPPVEAPPPPKPVAPAEPSPQVKANYTSQLLAQLERYQQYPEDARRKGIMGQPSIEIVLDRQGRVLSAKLLRGSGHESLDDEAVAMAQRASPFPPLPDEMPGQTRVFNIPINFNLR